ncbi:hypothetical protein [Tritonibacter mobilis]|uniref:hypothetical protein n=1 Tax=Tritonibacter mobilis TaxID=379347 RepID=UPI0013A52EF1|nr:hypothetical protein [Tritonibacter mobilis]
MKAHEDQVLRLATEAKGDWIKLPDRPEYAQAAIDLQSQGKMEVNGFDSAGTKVRLKRT